MDGFTGFNKAAAEEPPKMVEIPDQLHPPKLKSDAFG